jgi:hypothetical protein
MNGRAYIPMRKSSELNSEDLRISTYLPQTISDFVRELGTFSSSMPLPHAIFTLFMVQYRAYNNYNVQKLVTAIFRNACHSHLSKKRA